MKQAVVEELELTRKVRAGSGVVANTFFLSDIPVMIQQGGDHQAKHGTFSCQPRRQDWLGRHYNISLFAGNHVPMM